MLPSNAYNRVDFLLDVAHTVINRNPELSAKAAARKVIAFVDEIEKAIANATESDRPKPRSRRLQAH